MSDYDLTTVVTAHNIEDAAREAASFAIHEKELLGLQKELNIVIKYGALVEQHRKLLYVSWSINGCIVEAYGTNKFAPLGCGIADELDSGS